MHLSKEQAKLKHRLNTLLLREISSRGNLETCKACIDAGADVHKTPSFLPELVATAARQHNEKLCMLLLEPDKDIKDIEEDYNQGRSALNYAAD